MAIRQIRIKHYGRTIGYANVDDDGVMTFILTSDSQDFGRILAPMIDRGLVTDLSISPIIIPPEQRSQLDVEVEIIPGDRAFKDRISPNVKPIRY